MKFWKSLPLTNGYRTAIDMQNAFRKLFQIIGFLSFWFTTEPAWAKNIVTGPELAADLRKADSLLISYKNDSASGILERIVHHLKRVDSLDSPFGLHAQLSLATAKEHDDQETSAISLLLHVQELSFKQKLWETYTKSNLVLALLYERLGRKDQSLAVLRLAQSSIQKHSLERYYPMFAVRISSWHRLFGAKDSSLYYAEEALRTAKQEELQLEEAISHMLLGMLKREISTQEALYHSIAAVRIYQELEDYTGVGYMYTGIARIYFSNHRVKKALIYNDSIIIASKMAISIGHERNTSLFGAYKFRGRIYQELGKMDSALFYIQKGYEMEKSYLEETEKAKVIEIDARYNDAKKAQKIAEQLHQIQNDEYRRNALVSILFFVILLTFVLLFYTRRLRTFAEKNEKQAEKLKNLDELKSRFFANISHELRTPLTLILGAIKNLSKRSEPGDKQVIMLDIAERNGQQLKKLIDDLLDLQKLETGQMKLNLQPTGLSDFYRNYLIQFRPLAEAKQIDYILETEIGKDVIANIDREKCRQILYNLLSNALKYTPEGGTIKVQLSQTKNNLLFVVSDSGPGIHPEDISKVFDRYYQTSRFAIPLEGGVGIGLALCREYANLFGGQITVNSKLDEGSTFRLLFPLILVENANVSGTGKKLAESFLIPNREKRKNPSNQALITTPNFGKPNILVVEDNPDLREYIQLILSSQYHVHTVENGQQALKLLLDSDSRTNFDLILSDLMMPVMDGFQLLKRLKSEDMTRHLPVLMLTARVEAQTRLKALRIGVDDYLLKPFDEDELRVRIEKQLQNFFNRKVKSDSDNSHDLKSQLQKKTDQEWLTEFESYIKQNIFKTQLSVPILAQEFAMSESTLLRHLKRLTGLTSARYLQEIRLDAARKLLEKEPQISINTLASKVGYKDSRSFSRSFKNRYGKTPSSWIQGVKK